MKSTGIIRKMDKLGRIVLPAELRKQFGIAQKDDIEVYTDGDMIILKKSNPSCVFCGSGEELISFEDKSVCASCAGKLKETL